MEPPLIIVHRGAGTYLKYTLEAAVLFNPEKRVIFLGDRADSDWRDSGVENIPLADYVPEPAIDLLDRVFTHGWTEFRERPWSRLALERWFIIANFVKRHDIRSFWTFKSDTLILTGLAGLEPKLYAYNCTGRCTDQSINGFIPNLQVIDGYLEQIKEVLHTVRLAGGQRRAFQALPRRPCLGYHDQSEFKRLDLGATIDGEVLLEPVYSPYEPGALPPDEYALYGTELKGRELRQIYAAPDGSIYMYHQPSRQFVRLATIDMSGAPDSLFESILEYARRKRSGRVSNSVGKTQLYLLDLSGSRCGPPVVDQRPFRKKLAVPDRLRQKLKRMKEKDPNIYPLY